MLAIILCSYEVPMREGYEVPMREGSIIFPKTVIFSCGTFGKSKYEEFSFAGAEFLSLMLGGFQLFLSFLECPRLKIL